MATKSSSATFAIEARPYSATRPVKSAPQLRPVPAFSIESLQKNTFVMGPPKAQKREYNTEVK